MLSLSVLLSMVLLLLICTGFEVRSVTFVILVVLEIDVSPYESLRGCTTDSSKMKKNWRK